MPSRSPSPAPSPTATNVPTLVPSPAAKILSPVSLPVVACADYSQLGLVHPDVPATATATTDASTASALEFYADANLMVLAPRGWACAGWFGSSGQQLWVVPTLPSSVAPSAGIRGAIITTPVVYAAFWTSSTSGCGLVFEVGSTLFDELKPAPAPDNAPCAGGFRSTPWPGEVVHQFSPRQVGFLDPAGTAGAGTVESSGIAVSDRSVQGLVTIAADASSPYPDLWIVSASLPTGTAAGLTDTIVSASPTLRRTD